MHQDCAECQRQWDDFGKALRECVRIGGDLRLAAPIHTTSKSESFAQRLEEAEAARNRLGEAFKHHEEFAHGQAMQ